MRDLLAWWPLLLLLLLPGCSPTPSTPSTDGGQGARTSPNQDASGDRPTPVPTLRGLTLVTAEPLPTTLSGTAHLARLLVRDGRVYGANGSAGLMSWQLDAQGLLTPRSSTEPLGPGAASTTPSTYPRCVAETIDPTGRWLYCSSADSGVAVFDLRNPDDPVVVDRGALLLQDGLGFPDVRVADGALLAAVFNRGLLRATPGADGRLGPWQATGVTGDVVGLGGGNGDALVALDRRRGLLHLTAQNGVLEAHGVLALDGPPLGVTVHGNRAAVALGSSGVALVDLDLETPRIVQQVTPPCVATRADFTDTTLAVACSTGVWLYDLRGAMPRLADFDAGQYGVLDVTFVDAGRRLLVADWRTLLVYQVDPAGHAYLPDVSAGAYLRPGEDAVVVARNPGDVTLSLTLSRITDDPGRGTRSEFVQALAAMPGEVVRFRVPAAQLSAWLDPRQRAAGFQVMSRESSAWQRVSQGTVWFIVPDGGQPGGRPPAEGEAFPHLAARAGSLGPAALPPPGPVDLVLLLPDCALQWGAVEDLAWHLRHGRLTPARQLLMLRISFGNGSDGSARTETLQRLDAAELGGYALSDYLDGVAGGRSSGDYVDAQLTSRPAGGGGDYTEVFRLDAAGVVQHTERIYRGNWPLR